MTTAVAVVDLNGRVIAVKSKKEFKKQEILEFISQYGKPLIVATDKKKPPKFVEKIASTCGCILFSPRNDMQVEEKNVITKEFGLSVHEKDAVASAKYAYKNYILQFSKIDTSLSSLGLGKYGDKVKEMILLRKAKNIAEAIERVVKC